MPGSVGGQSVKMREASGSDEGYEDEEEDSEQGYDSDGSEASMGLNDASGSAGWTVVEASAIRRLQTDAVDSICSMLGCKPSVAKCLLMHYRWDKEALSSVLAEQGSESVYKVAGVADTRDSEAGTSGGGGAAGGGAGTALHKCLVCFCDVPPPQRTQMDCTHTYCNECWAEYFKTQIGEGHARNLRCMAYKCGIMCDEDKVLSLLSGGADGGLRGKYEHALLQSFIEDNNSVRFCPSAPWCGRAVQVEGDPFCEPECCCGAVFCFKCSKAPHSPATCAMWDKWDEKICGDSETRNWMMANTKPCPKCSKPVEKNGGCNHVVCKCGQAFCWLCGEGTGLAHSWSSINGHECGRWKEEMDRKVDEAARNHKRYMHYFERFKTHGDSYTKESANRGELLKKIEVKMEGGVEARDYSWLVRALDQLKAARSVLSNTYAFAYFFFGNDMYKDDFSPEENVRNQNLFEQQQQMLEVEVERLSGLVTKCSESLTLDPQERVAVINSTVSIERRIVKLYDLVENDCYGRLQTCSAQIAVYKPKKMA